MTTGSLRADAFAARDAQPRDLDALAALWHAGWQDAHAAILPAELARHRTLAGMRQRLAAGLAQVRVVDLDRAPAGFAWTLADELYQLYVAPRARGTGVAAGLLLDAEAAIAARGHARAWLACAIGNARAARFYARHGWERVGVVTSRLPVPGGEFALDVWRYEKAMPG